MTMAASVGTLMPTIKDKQFISSGLENSSNSVVNAGHGKGGNTTSNLKQTPQAMSVGSYKKFGGLGPKDDQDYDDDESE